MTMMFVCGMDIDFTLSFRLKKVATSISCKSATKYLEE